MVEEELPSLERSEEYQGSTRAEALMDELQDSVLEFEPNTDPSRRFIPKGWSWSKPLRGRGRTDC